MNNDLQGRDKVEYPCQVVNRFQCPYERTNNKGDDDGGTAKSYFDVDDLFRLQKIAFVVEIALAKARKDDSVIRIKNKEELLHVLTDREIFGKILEQGADAHEISEGIKNYLRKNRTSIRDYFIRIKA